MDNKELLQAMRAIMQEEIRPITKRLDNIESDMSDLKTTVSTLEGQTKENTEMIKAIQDNTEVTPRLTV
ncbi:hypothetical protein SDC9_20897 [bioreactor metagenome]|uniref:Uncharacterized protein n=1 Tax=bioreactor metagenome TaxID=1076179 RepID=A0A644U7Z4_9ZZZZ|nr:hypothetical protein [Negativicutes bacterium]